MILLHFYQVDNLFLRQSYLKSPPPSQMSLITMQKIIVHCWKNSQNTSSAQLCLYPLPLSLSHTHRQSLSLFYLISNLSLLFFLFSSLSLSLSVFLSLSVSPPLSLSLSLPLSLSLSLLSYMIISNLSLHFYIFLSVSLFHCHSPPPLSHGLSLSLSQTLSRKKSYTRGFSKSTKINFPDLFFQGLWPLWPRGRVQEGGQRHEDGGQRGSGLAQPEAGQQVVCVCVGVWV